MVAVPQVVEPVPESYPVAAFVFAVGLATVHLSSGTLLRPERGRIRQWLSVGSGASVAYVFVLLLPEVSEVSVEYAVIRGGELFFEQAIYFFALVGFTFFYGIEVLVARRTAADIETAPAVYWAHLGVFAAYSALIGYLLFHQEVPGVLNLFFYAVAMGFHFAVTDYGIHRHHGTAYDRTGRWVLAGATLCGAIAGLVYAVNPTVLLVLFAFVIGSIVLNVIKEELPDAQEGLFVPFIVGALGYSVLVLFI